jgi:hypothetical protein
LAAVGVGCSLIAAHLLTGRQVAPDPLAPLAVARFDAGRAAPDVRLAAHELEEVTNGLLAAVSPSLLENRYFSDFAKDKLSWAYREHNTGRLTVAPFPDPERVGLPPDVLMAAARLDGQPTIFISMPRLDALLREPGHAIHPFSRQLINAFAIALIHEILHLQNPNADPREADSDAFSREESRVYREVSLGVVRPLRLLNQPLPPTLIEIDDALRRCGDELPCLGLAELVRLDRPRP